MLRFFVASTENPHLVVLSVDEIVLKTLKFEALPWSSRKRNVRIWRHFFHVFVGKTQRIKSLKKKIGMST